MKVSEQPRHVEPLADGDATAQDRGHYVVHQGVERGGGEGAAQVDVVHKVEGGLGLNGLDQAMAEEILETYSAKETDSRTAFSFAQIC